MGQRVLHARLLGGLNLRIGDEPLPALGSARAESLLAFLLLHRDAPQPRQRIAFLLWPDSSEAQARTNLRKVLHNLRRALPEADDRVEFGPRTLQWRADAPLWLDVDQFEHAMGEGRLEDAVELYAGELLEGSYDEWLVQERERLARLHLEALGGLARQHARQERWPDAIRHAERLVAGDLLREESHRLLIELCHAAGDRARALRTYHVCVSTLQRELGIEPSAATRAVYEAVLDATPSDAADIAGASPFIGRRDELHTLRAVWHDAAAGRAQLVLVSGEAGIGKTRLLDELRGQTAAVTAEARAYPAEDSIVYGLPTAWLRSRAVEKRLSRLEREHLIELGRLLPELSGHVPAPEPLPEAELRRRLFAAIVRALLAAGSPLLLIADDVHWADEQSLRLIRYLLRAAPSARLLVAATARREELDERHPVGRMVSALQTDARYTEIGLERLDRAETGQLAARISGKGLSKSELDHLYGDSEGNPLFIVEALRPDAPAATTKVQAVIVRRLERLSEPAGELVGTAAAIGRSFAADVLAAAAGLEDRAFVRALDELWRRGIVRDHGPGAYDFSHGRIRDAAYARLSPPRRRQAHLAIARALEQSEGAAAASIARHYESAAAPADAIRWHERAAGNAQWLHAHSEAVLELERALTLSEELQPGRDKARLQLRLLTALPAPLLAVAGYAPERLSEIHAKARQLAAQLAVDPEPPLVWSMALSALVRGEWQTGRELAERLRARAQRNQDPVLRVESDYILGIASYWVGELRSARSHFEAAIELFRPERRRAHVLRYGQDPELVVRLRLAHTLWLLGHDAAADRQRELALAAVHDSSHPYSRAITYLWAAIFAMDRADVAEFRRQVHAVDPYVTDDAPGQVRLPMELFTGYLEVLDGHREVGLARLRDAQEQLVAAPFTPGQPGLATRILLAGHAVAAEPEQGLALADAALGMGRGAELWEAEIRRLRAIFLAELGAFAEEVQAELDLALGVARRQGARAFERRIRGTLTERRASHDRVL